MDLALYAAEAVVSEGRSVRQVAAATGRSKSWVQRKAVAYREGGEPALSPKKRGPKVALNQTEPAIEDAIVALRKSLSELGLDAGASTIAYHLKATGAVVPSRATIHRILSRRGFVTPQPQKRPRSSWQRFEASLPNECWQTDMTHWQLRDGAKVEIVNFIDDYSRAVMASVAVKVATAEDVVRIFYSATRTYGFPAAVLSDNGAIYTAAYRGSHSGLEIDLAALGITFRHGRPYHPQTQGKVERYHRTLKAYLRKRPQPRSLKALQSDIDRFVLIYNEERPHQARGCPPLEAWRALDKAAPAKEKQRLLASTKVRHDIVDKTGVVTIRYRSKLHHAFVGRKHAGTRVLMLMADLDLRVIDVGSGKLIQHLIIDPSVDYQGSSRSIL